MAAAAASPPKLQDIVECPICLETLTEPRMFSCFHFYCQKCVEGLKNTKQGSTNGYECPLCHKFTATWRLKSLPLVNKIVAAISAGNENTPKCGSCDGQAAAWRCLDCKENYCEACRRHHDKLKVLRGHKFEEIHKQPKPIINDVMYCDEHQSKQVTHYCFDCKQLTCSWCRLITHTQHSAATIDEALERILPVARKCQVEVKANIEAIKVNIADVKHSESALKKMYEGVRKDVKADYDDVMAKLNADFVKLSQTIESSEETNRAKMTLKMNDLELQLRNQSNIFNLTESTLDTAKHASLLATLMREVFQPLNGSVKSTSSAVPEVKPPLVTYSKSKFAHGSLLGRIYEGEEAYEKLSGQQLQISYKELISSKIQQLSELKITCSRFNFIKGELWCVNNEAKNITVYSPDGVQQRKIVTLPKSNRNVCAIPYAVVEFNNRALVTTNDGLFSVATGSHFPANKIIAKDHLEAIVDCAVLRNDIYILRFNSYSQEAVVEIWRYCSGRNVILPQRSIKLVNVETSDIEANTIEVTSDHIFLASYHGDVIQQYSNATGELVEYGKPGGKSLGELSGPILSGRDKNGDLLVVNAGNKRLDVLRLMHDGTKKYRSFSTLSVGEFHGFLSCVRVYNDKLYVSFPDSGIVRVFTTS